MISYHNGYSLDGQLNQQINKYVIVADTLEFQGKLKFVWKLLAQGEVLFCICVKVAENCLMIQYVNATEGIIK